MDGVVKLTELIERARSRNSSPTVAGGNYATHSTGLERLRVRPLARSPIAKEVERLGSELIKIARSTTSESGIVLHDALMSIETSLVALKRREQC